MPSIMVGQGFTLWHKGLSCLRKALRQITADPLPCPIRIGEDDDAPLLIGCFNLFKGIRRQGKAACFDCIASRAFLIATVSIFPSTTRTSLSNLVTLLFLDLSFRIFTLTDCRKNVKRKFSPQIRKEAIANWQQPLFYSRKYTVTSRLPQLIASE